MNATQTFDDLIYRPTVAGLMYCIGSKEEPLIGLHWPRKAALVEEPNLTVVSGQLKKNETVTDSMMRHVLSEYRCLREDILDIVPLELEPLLSPATHKQYSWCIVHVIKPSNITQPAPREVASFGWYTPKQLQSGIDQMHTEKQKMFRLVLKLAIEVQSDLIPFKKRFG
jgi:hypothetical protein